MTEAKKSFSSSRGARAASVGLSFAAILMSCSNMLTGNDMTTKIGSAVAAANAAQVTVHIQPDPDMSSAGIPSPMGDSTQKVGIPFNLSTTVSNLYVFNNWSQVGGNNEISFGSAASANTTATVAKAGTGFTIQANYTLRPTVSSTDPFNGTTSVGINKSIKIVFSEPVETSSLVNNIIVTTINYSELGGTPAPITANFPLTYVGPSDATATPKTVTGVLLVPKTAMGVTQYITVTCKKGISDSSGNNMASDYSFAFITGTSLIPPPVLSNFIITKGDGTALGSPDDAFNSTPAVIGLTIGGSTYPGQSIIDCQVTETAYTPSGVQSGTSVVTDLHTFSSTAIPYTLKTTGQGYKLIQVQVEDNYYQWTAISGGWNWSVGYPQNGLSNYDTCKILYDTSPITVSGLTLSNTANGGSQYTKASAIAVGFASSKSATPAAVLTGYIIKDSAATTTAPLIGDSGWTSISGGLTSYSGSAVPYTLSSFANAATSNVYVYVKDEAGNIGSVNTSIIGDTVPPAVTGTVSPATTGNPGFAKNGQTVSVAFTMLEATSGLNASSPSVKIGGQPATISGTYPNFMASLTLAGTTVTEGTLTYTIDATDNSGNAMTEVVGSTGIVYDRTAPTFAVGTITTNGNAGYAKTGNTITVNFAATETGSGFASGSPSATIDGQTATVTGTYPNYVASYTFTGSEPEATAGYVISGTDRAGNMGSSSGSTGILIDHTAPMFAVGTITTSGNIRYAKTGNTITVNFTATETGSGFATGSPSATIDGKTAIVTGTYPSYTASCTIVGTEPQTTAGYVINGTDKAGNAATAVSGSTGILVDYTAPTISALTISSNHSGYGAWATTGDTITLGITASDAGSGLNSGSATIAGKSATASTTIATYQLVAGDGVVEGVASYSVTIADKAGNSTTVQTGSTGTATVTGSVTVDRTGPVLTLTSFAANTSTHNTVYANSSDTVKLIFTAKDALVGITAAPTVGIVVGGAAANGTLTQPNAVPVAGGTTQSYTATYALSPLDAEGPIAYTVTATDALGNSTSSPLSGNSVTFYKTIPTIGTVSFNTPTGTWAGVGTTVSLSIPVTVGTSGLNGKPSVAFTSGGAAVTGTVTVSGSGSPYTASYTVGSGDTAGAIGYTIDASNNAGIGATQVSATSTKSTDPVTPTIGTVSVTAPSGTYAGVGATVSLSIPVTVGTSGLNGKPSVAFTSGGAAVTGTVTVSGSGSPYTASYTVGSGDTAGAIGYTINASNNGGCSATQVSATSTKSADPVTPTIGTVSFNTPTGTWAGVGTTVSLSIPVTVGTSGLNGKPSVAFTSGGAAVTGTVTVSGSGSPYTASYTVGSGDTAGAIGYTINASNNGGCSATQVHIATSSVSVDLTAPSIKTSSNKPVCNTSFTLTFYLSSAEASGVQSVNYWIGDGGAGTEPTTPDNATTTPSSETATGVAISATLSSSVISGGDFCFTVVDAAGNETASAYNMAYNSGTGVWDYNTTVSKSLLGNNSTVFPVGAVALRNVSSSSRPIFTDPVFSTTYSGQATPRADETAAVSKLRSDIVMEPINMRYAPTVAAQTGLNRSIDTSSLSILQRSAKAAAASAAKAAAQSSPLQKVRYSETNTAPEPRLAESTKSASAPSGQGPMRTTQGSSTRAMGGAPESARSAGASVAQGSAPSLQARASSSDAASSPVGPKTPAPGNNSVPRPDFCLRQARERREEDAETSEGEE